jgi:glutaredoxin-like YruB-family protein
MAKKEHQVIVYSTTTCPWCTVAKNFLKENHIEFTEKNVGSDRKAAEEMIEKSGQMGVPVIDIDGEIIIGFDKSRIEQLLGLN